ncbi:hypothetical protein Glove_30g157 [Diversispora epigaea]|uniref:Uncharacterized protein n=1 Tax=Diversispora epigaea TaxID=1348612 RepID=A0A397JP41_9GLOM|nr:hypothetical protein Glove_30g157 [Diversispora epigaea]
MDNYMEHELFKKNPPTQLTLEGFEKLDKAYDEGLKRIKEVYHQEVIKIEKVNIKGRRHIEVIKTNISSKKKSPQKRKEPEKNNESTTHPILHQLTESFSTENINKQSNIPDNENCTSKRQRIVTMEEEKNKLKHLLIKDTLPTEEEIKEVLKELPSAWNSQRVKRYYSNNKITKKK